MLDLGQPLRSEAGVDLASDSDDPLSFHILPPPPRVAVRDGRPQLQLLRLVRDGALAGGHLRLAVELAHPAAKLEAAAAALAARLRRDSVTLRPLAVTSAEAELLFIGRETTTEGGLGNLVRRGYGQTDALFSPPHAAVFSVSLAPEGVRLMEAALRSGGAPVGINYRLTVEGLWPAHRVVARVDWARAYEQVSMQAKSGALLFAEDIRRIAESLIETRAVRIEAVQSVVPTEGQPAPDPGAALAWIQHELVERFCVPVMPLSREPAQASLGTLGEIFGVGRAFAAKRLQQIEQAVAEVDFQGSVVVARTYAAQAHLADLLSDVPADSVIADAQLDHPFFRRFVLGLRSARPLAELHLQEVVAGIGYGTAQGALRLIADTAEARFESWADASPDGSWTLQPEVTFAADAPLEPSTRVSLAPLRGSGREVVLDLERLLGLKRIEVAAPSDPRVLLSRVALTARRDGVALAEQELVLAAGGPGQTAWFREIRPGDRITAQPRHLLADGRSVDGAPIAVETRLLRLPPAFAGVLTVQLIGDEDWEGLAQVVVALQKTEGLPAGSFVFDKPGLLLPVNLDMPDPADRSFRYRMTRNWADGRVEEDGWVTTDVPVVAVGRSAANRLVVELALVGPELPVAGILLIHVELSYIDVEHRLRDVQTAVFRARTDRFRWEVAISDPNRRSYEYRITVNGTDGQSRTGPWRTAMERLLPIPIVRT